MSKLKRLVGKVAIVTASTDGIGFAIAERLAREGARVVVSSRKQKNVIAAEQKLKSQGLDVIGMVCHAGDDAQRKSLISETVKRLGNIDILVSNAAVSTAFGDILNTTEVQYDKMMDINVKATFFLIKEAVPHMNRGGSIIIVGSHGGFSPSPVIGIYSVTKTALMGLTKALMHQLSSLNIRVNNLAPGLIKTNFSKALWNNDVILETSLERCALHRIGEPEEIGSVAAFLASDDASYITGETVAVAGGTLSRL